MNGRILLQSQKGSIEEHDFLVCVMEIHRLCHTDPQPDVKGRSKDTAKRILEEGNPELSPLELEVYNLACYLNKVYRYAICILLIGDYTRGSGEV
jgi:hypothetical protein